MEKFSFANRNASDVIPASVSAPGINLAESPLSWLRSRKNAKGKAHVSDIQFLAGEKLRSDYERAMLAARVTANWDPSATANRSSAGVPGQLTDGAIAARQRFHGAIDAVGPELSSMLVQVCCLSAGLEQAERLLNLPARSGKAVLCLGLTALARHYGFLRDVRQKDARTAVWSLPDYRPAIPAADG